MNTEKEKAIESLKWLELFDFMRVRVSNYAINEKTFNNGLKNEIDKMKKECNKIIAE